MGMCTIVMMKEGENKEMRFEFPSTAVAKLYPIHAIFSSRELVEKFNESVDICYERVLQSHDKGMAEEQIRRTRRVNTESILFLREENIFRVISVNTQACMFANPYRG